MLDVSQSLLFKVIKPNFNGYTSEQLLMVYCVCTVFLMLIRPAPQSYICFKLLLATEWILPISTIHPIWCEHSMSRDLVRQKKWKHLCEHAGLPTFFTADVLACHSRKSTGGIDNIKIDSSPLRYSGIVHTGSLVWITGRFDGTEALLIKLFWPALFLLW